MEQWPTGYTPSSSDLTHARFLQQVFYQLMRDGKLPEETWKPINAAAGWPASYTTMVIQPEGPAMRVEFMAEACEYMDKIGLGQRAWWNN